MFTVQINFGVIWHFVLSFQAVPNDRCLFIYLFVISPHELQAQLVNHHETLPRDQYLVQK